MTQEDSPIGEEAREVEEDEEATEEAVDPKVAPTIRTTLPSISMETSFLACL